MSGLYKLTGRAWLGDIGRFFRTAGTNVFRFLPGELRDLSEYLLEKVKEYVPVRTGILKSSLMAQADINAIQVVARTDIQVLSEYAKEYAEYVEAGVFGKDKTKMIKTPHMGGPILVKSPKFTEGNILDRIVAQALGEAAIEVQNGYAQFMRAGIFDAMPVIIENLKRIIDYKAMKEYRKYVT